MFDTKQSKPSEESQKTTAVFNSIQAHFKEPKSIVASTQDNRGTAKFMSVDDSEDYE
jgi:hypothetical protein